MLDNIRSGLNNWAEGNECVCVTPEAISDWLDDNESEKGDEMYEFLSLTLKSIKKKKNLGDIIFNK